MNDKLKIGVLKETKTPPDERVVLTPSLCKEVMEKYPNVDLVVQSSDIRRIKDQEYIDAGVEVVTDVSDRDVLLGVKEVKMDTLLPNKHYFFFSHTIKEQPYNRELLRTILSKKIQLTDWETLTAKSGGRLIGFGRYAGIVGAYNGLIAWGNRFNAFTLKPAHECEDRNEFNLELNKVKLPNIKIALTGAGRVAKGAMEVLDSINIKKVSPSDYLTKEFNEPVYTQLEVNDYFSYKGKNNFEKSIAYNQPEDMVSDFMKYADKTDMFIPCHYWDDKSPFIFTREDAKKESFNIKVIADISCDIDGPIASTLRPSTVADPIYGYNPETEKEGESYAENNITVMAVDNLPCELPKDASQDFGREFINHILTPLVEEDKDTIIERATMTSKEGKLTAYYKHLQNFVDGI